MISKWVWVENNNHYWTYVFDRDYNTYFGKLQQKSISDLVAKLAIL